jgi:hypothetical protein
MMTDAKNSNDNEIQTEIKAILFDTAASSKISLLPVASGEGVNEGEQMAFPL